ncbi:MAG: biopolymer transporter ExbD [Gammaproteobacteria bacterium]|nr:biopolymer transporter ExbD [Gammaproteobacteria bacterium]
MNFRPRRMPDPEINLISLIDVMLMIVIFFMLSSTFTDEGRLRIRLPEASARSVPPDSAPLVLAIGADGRYRLDGRELVDATPDALRTGLLSVLGEGRTRRIVLRADARATHQSVVTAMDVIAKLGLREVDVATVQEAAR